MNSKRLPLILIVLFASSLWDVSTARPDEAKIRVGDRIGQLSFKDIRYLPRTLADLGDKKAFVIVCTNTTCPLVKRYLPKLKSLEAEYRDRGVQFLSLNVSSGDSIREMAAHAVEYDVPFPSVKDVDGSCVQALGVERTPEAVVLDAAHKLRYRGRIDDQYRLGGVSPRPVSNDLQNALDSVLTGRDVENESTAVDGCVITQLPVVEPEQPVTFAEHVKPLLQQHCVECHRPGTEAPFSLATYEDALKPAGMIAEVVAEQRMPPWYASSRHGDFVNRRGMTFRERATLILWVNTGMQRGSAGRTRSVESVEPAGKWQIGEPDRVISMADEHALPADGYIPYRYVLLPYVFTHDTWVEAIEILPDNTEVVHHCNMFLVPLGKDFKSATFVTGKVPGAGPMDLDPGIGVPVPKGSIVGLQIHYTSTGKQERCRISVGFRYARHKIVKQLKLLQMVNNTFAIPPGDPHHEVRSGGTVERDITGVGLFSHMHLRGKDMTFFAHYPDGRTENLLMIPNYSFDWQLAYRWDKGTKKFPQGTRFECIAHYDNSSFNPYNPDPTATVREGRQTYHEMMYGFFFYTEDDEQLNLEIDPNTGRLLGDGA